MANAFTQNSGSLQLESSCSVKTVRIQNVVSSRLIARLLAFVFKREAFCFRPVEGNHALGVHMCTSHRKVVSCVAVEWIEHALCQCQTYVWSVLYWDNTIN